MRTPLFLLVGLLAARRLRASGVAVLEQLSQRDLRGNRQLHRDLACDLGSQPLGGRQQSRLHRGRGIPHIPVDLHRAHGNRAHPQMEVPLKVLSGCAPSRLLVEQRVLRKAR